MTTEPGPTPARALHQAQPGPDPAARAQIRADLASSPPPKPAQMTRTFSYILDDLVQVPGTKVRIGVDPFLSFIPWAGTAMGAAFGSVVMADAIRLRAPLPVLLRMGTNSLLDWALGMIPFVGAFFDVAFRANKMNLKLLNRTIENRELVRKASIRYWIGVAALVVTMVALMVAIPVLVIAGINHLIATTG